MAGHLGMLRSRILTPKGANSSARERGFHVKDEETTTLLETGPGYFRAGFAAATETGDPQQCATRIESLPEQFRGFAYEGAAMGLAVLDALPVGRSDRARGFIAGPAKQYAHNAHVGLGFAIAKVPKMRRRVIAPTDPLLKWRAVDGYGFFRAFFNTEQFVYGHQRETAAPWPGLDHGDYVQRAVDLGIGRAVWFVGGAAVERVCGLIAGFEEDRRPELWSGVGLAATYAGGADGRELADLAIQAGSLRPYLAQGAALAAMTRARGGAVPHHTDVATSVLCGSEARVVARTAEAALAELPPDGPMPAYEVWRQRLVTEFAQLDRR